jgi:hypothetical protein
MRLVVRPTMRRRKLLVALAGLAVVIVAGVVVLWPRPDRITPGELRRHQGGNEQRGGRRDSRRTARRLSRCMDGGPKYPGCFDIDDMASHVECNRDFEAYGEPMWFASRGIICVWFKSGFVVEPPAGLQSTARRFRASTLIAQSHVRKARSIPFWRAKRRGTAGSRSKPCGGGSCSWRWRGWLWGSRPEHGCGPHGARHGREL